MRNKYNIIVFSLFLISFFLIPSLPIVDSSSYDSQEQTFSVNPTPFWDITTYGTSSIIYDDYKVKINNDNYIDSNSIYEWNETIKKNDGIYAPDGFKHKAHYGYAYASPINYYYTTWVNDGSSFGSGALPYSVYLYLYFNATDKIYNSGNIQITLDWRCWRSSGSSTPTAYIQIWNWDTSSFTNIYSIATADTGWEFRTASIEYDEDLIAVNKTILFRTWYTTASADNVNINIDYAFVDLLNDFHDVFSSINGWTFHSQIGTGAYSFVSDTDVGQLSVLLNSAGNEQVCYKLTGLSISHLKYWEIRYKTDTLAKFYLQFLDADLTPVVNSINGVRTSDVWITTKGYLSDIGTDGTITEIRLYIDDYSDASSSGYMDIWFDYLRIGYDYEMGGYARDGSTIERIKEENLTGWKYFKNTDGQKLEMSLVSIVGSMTFADLEFLFNDDTSGYIEMDYYPIIEIKYKIDYINATSFYWVYRSDDNYKYESPTESTTSDWKILRVNAKAFTQTPAGSPYYLRMCGRSDATNSWVNISVDYISFFSIAGYTASFGNIENDDYYYVDENKNLVMDVDQTTAGEYIRLDRDWTIYIIGIDSITYYMNMTANLKDEGFYLFSKVDSTWYSNQNYFFKMVEGSFVDFRIQADSKDGNVGQLIIDSLEFMSYANTTIEIPINAYRNHKFLTMIEKSNTGNLSITTKNNDPSIASFNWEFYDNSIEFGNIEDSVTNYDILRLEIDLKYSTNLYKVTIFNENNTRMESYSIFEGFSKSCTKFIMTLTNITGTVTLYYLSGDFEYTSYWNKIVTAEHVGVDANDIPVTLNQLINDNPPHDPAPYIDIDYNIFMSQFQFYRTEIGIQDYTDYLVSPSGAYEFFNITHTFEFYHSNGTIYYKIVAFIAFDDPYGGSPLGLYGRIVLWKYINGVPNILFETQGSSGDYLGTPHTIDLRAKLGVWRTQENHIGLKFVDSYDKWDEETDISVFTSYITDDYLENYQANITISYFFSSAFTLNDYTIITLDAQEYSYNNLNGVSEPHFSTTWWEQVPIVREIIWGFMWLINAIVSGLGIIFSFIVEGAVLLFTPLFNGIVAALGAIAGAVWTFFEALLNSIYSAIVGIASGIWALFQAAIDAIVSGISDLVNGIAVWLFEAWEAGLPLVIGFLSAWVEAFIWLLIIILDWVGSLFGIPTLGTDIANAVSLFIQTTLSVFTFISSLIDVAITAIAQLVYYITRYGGTALFFIGIFVVLDISLALISTDVEQIQIVFNRYINITDRLFGMIYRIYNTIINFIGGIIP